jgi:hypothetical protein
MGVLARRLVCDIETKGRPLPTERRESRAVASVLRVTARAASCGISKYRPVRAEATVRCAAGCVGCHPEMPNNSGFSLRIQQRVGKHTLNVASVLRVTARKAWCIFTKYKPYLYMPRLQVPVL